MMLCANSPKQKSAAGQENPARRLWASGMMVRVVGLRVMGARDGRTVRAGRSRAARGGGACAAACQQAQAQPQGEKQREHTFHRFPILSVRRGIFIIAQTGRPVHGIACKWIIIEFFHLFDGSSQKPSSFALSRRRRKRLADTGGVGQPFYRFVSDQALSLAMA